MARPTKYTPELLDKARDYLDNWETLGDVLPSHVGLAIHLSLGKSTLYDWGKEKNKAEFSDILENLLCLQERELLNKGLLGGFNATLTKLVLSKHGYSDKQAIEYSGEVIETK